MELDISKYLPSDIFLQIIITCDVNELNYCKLVCKSFYNYINLNPKLFWFKHPIKIRRCHRSYDFIQADIIDIFDRNDLIIRKTPDDSERYRFD